MHGDRTPHQRPTVRKADRNARPRSSASFSGLNTPSSSRPSRSQSFPTASQRASHASRTTFGEHPIIAHTDQPSRGTLGGKRRLFGGGFFSRLFGHSANVGYAPRGRDAGFPGSRMSENPLKRFLPLIVAAAALVALIALISYGCSALAGGGGEPEQNDEQAAAAAAMPQESRVSFVAVGDNLPDDAICDYADAMAGEVGDGAHDFTSVYEPLKPYIEGADLAYMSQETHLGGEDLGIHGYPSFNTADEMADAAVATGFDFVAAASNHAYDWGYFGANEHSCEVWRSKPVAFTGAAANEEDAAEIVTLERNGITFALLSYTYGVNGYEPSDLPSYAVNFIDEERIRTDVARAKEMVDVVMVAMHWGTENLTEADEYQTRYAQLLADLEVDVVLGSHPHVIGPMAWVEGANGTKTLVAYSMGNFISNHDAPSPINELEGMLRCDFVKKDGDVSIENVAWVPLVNHSESDNFRVYALKDYSNELATQHPTLAGLEDPTGWLREQSAAIVGGEFSIDA